MLDSRADVDNTLRIAQFIGHINNSQLKLLLGNSSGLGRLVDDDFMGWTTEYAAVCAVLGCVCVTLNLLVLSVIVANRRKALRNAFYIIVIQSAVVDSMRGICIVLWSLPYLYSCSLPQALLPVAASNCMQRRLLIFKVNQLARIVMRTCNLLTIINLFVFTLNEYLVIKHPLRHRYLWAGRASRKLWLVFVGTWGTAVGLVLGVMVIQRVFAGRQRMQQPSTAAAAANGSSHPSVLLVSDGDGEMEVEEEHSFSSAEAVQTVYAVGVIVFCYMCLTAVVLCYAVIMRTINKYHAGDDFNDEVLRKVSRDRMQVQGTRANSKHASRQGRSFNQPPGASPQVLSDSWRTRSVYVARHKYVLVIGSVLLVDILFLLPYSAIQISQLTPFFQLTGGLKFNAVSVRWILQMLIGVHAVIQPLCYFRMGEFRRFVKCIRRRDSSRSQYRTALQMRCDDNTIGKRSIISNRFDNSSTRGGTQKPNRSRSAAAMRNSFVMEREGASSAMAAVSADAAGSSAGHGHPSPTRTGSGNHLGVNGLGHSHSHGHHSPMWRSNTLTAGESSPQQQPLVHRHKRTSQSVNGAARGRVSFRQGDIRINEAQV